MKYCPKCRDYYEDEFLRFCLKDGVPLSSVSQLTEQWNQGKEIIRQTQKRIQKEIRRQKLKRILIMLITTILVMMVVSVMALQTWIYTHPNEVAEIKSSFGWSH